MFVSGVLRMRCAGLDFTHHSTHETYSPVGKRNLRMYWSGCQSTGADMRKYFTAMRLVRDKHEPV
jgi:hypothetical protein